MPSTFLSLHYHLVFSTKGRESQIAATWRSRLHQYLGGAVNGLGAQSQAVGGTADHVHLLVELRATHVLADFTVSASAVDEVRWYIENQEEHHQERSFREELKILLQRSGVKFEERYLD